MRNTKTAALAALVVVCLFTNNGVTGAQAPPAPWRSQDIGTPALAGDAVFAGETFQIDGAGADIWGRRDEFHFVYQAIDGDVDIRARIDSLARVHDWSKAGVMIRASLDADAAHGHALVSAAKGVAFQRRQAQGALSTHTAGPLTAAPRWVRLVRSGATLTSYTSSDGRAWMVVGRDAVALGRTAYVGLAVTSHEPERRSTAAFSNVAVLRPALPENQHSADIGRPALTGGVTHASGIYTVHAGGSDIWDAADQFHYVYQLVSGDVDIVARVRSITAAHRWSKAGVMIRETLDAGSRHAMALTSAQMGHAFQRRVEPSQWSSHTSGGSGTAPVWVRLVRTGNYAEALHSTDGSTWTSMGGDVLAMPETVYVGLAVTSHNVLATTTAALDNVRITSTGGDAPEPPPSAEEPTPPETAPRGVAFTASDDHDTLVTHYVLEVHAEGTIPGSAAPVATSNLGKPEPSSTTGDVFVDQSAFFMALAPGTYIATVKAVGESASARSESVTFTR